MWHATVLTIFPDMFPGPLGASLAGKALAAGIWRLEAIAVTIPAGRLIPEPPPSAEICDERSRKTSATTQVPMAK